MSDIPTTEDLAIIAQQLGRRPRSVVAIAWRCACGHPGVTKTAPRLDDGTPFPTTYYLTNPRAIVGCSALEADGVMVEYNARLADDAEFAAQYRAAHDAYLADRAELGDVPETAGFSAGGMPDRVKCLHALVAHSLAVGPGVNPVGDEIVERLGDLCGHPCQLETT